MPSPPRASPSEELGFTVVGLGTYRREFAREVREAAKLYGVEPLITDDYLEVEAQVAELQPELVLGTQMERHIAKRLGIPCAVISAPVHVQDFPARYSPQMGFEGANVIFDTWVHPLMMGLEEHLLTMFRDDFEFNDDAAPSHLARCQRRPRHGSPARSPGSRRRVASAIAVAWAPEAEKELNKIPFFVRGKARRNTERFADERGAGHHHRRDALRCQSALRPLTRPRIRVVIVTMDSHLSRRGRAGARDAAAARLPGLHLAMHAADEWGTRLRRRWRAATPTSPRRHRDRHDAVPGGPHPRRAAGAGGAPRRIATRWSAACRPARSCG